MRAVGGQLDGRAGADVRDGADRGACGGGRDGGEFEREAAAFAEFAFDADAAAVFFENFLAYGEAQSGAATAFARDEDGEDFFDVILLDAAAIVDDGDAGHSLGMAV